MGKNRIAVECTRVVRAAGDDVVLAVLDPADDGRDTWQPSFRRAAESEGLPTFDPVDINAPSGVARVQAAKPDFVFSFQYAQILKASVISAARIATLNLHFGPLPRYQGVSTIAWALINGERATGVTLHHIHRGVDSGDIVCAAPVPIALTDTGRSLYDKCVEAGISLFAEWYGRLRGGDVPRQPQDPTRALYYNRHSLDFKEREICSSADVENIANWIRAIIFPPLQYPVTRFGGNALEVSAVSWDRSPHRGRRGEVLDVGKDGIVVGVPGGRVFLKELRRDGSVVAHHRLRDLGIVPGAMLG